MDILSICKSCRNCCTGTEIRLIDSDLERWKAEERLDILLSINPLIGGSRQLIKKKESNDCIFLHTDGSCNIHETKPFICRIFPQSKKQARVFECKLIDAIELKEG